MTLLIKPILLAFLKSDSVFNMTTAGSDFSLEVITRAASQVLEVTEIERTIETTATTVSLSVFSQ